MSSQLKILLALRIALFENLCFDLRLLGHLADGIEIMAPQLRDAALRADSDDVTDANVEQMSEELIKSVICVAASEKSESLSPSRR